MLSTIILQAHYKEYADQPDGWVQNMEGTKKSIVKYVLGAAGFQPPASGITKAVVLGASDKRYIPIHHKIFKDITGRDVELTTFDIDIAHLSGGENIINHDVTKPFPNAPYHIIFSHELMKFLTSEEQVATIKNSYLALASGGVAMHIIHAPSIKGTAELRTWQNRVDPDQLIEKLYNDSIPAKKIFFQSDSEVDWLKETTVIMLQK